MKSILKLSFMTATVAILSASPAFAAPDNAALEREGIAVWQLLPRESEMIRYPGAISYEFYGNVSKAKTIKDNSIAGGEAVKVKISGVGTDPWSAGANVPTQLATKKGDVLAAIVYARASELPEGQVRAVMPIHIQQQGGSYKQYGSAQANLTKEWGRFVVYGALDQDFKDGEVGAALHLATGKQVIELGPVYIMNMGPGAVDASQMPPSGPIG